MHFIPQVIALANAWAAGYKKSDKNEKIQAIYDSYQKLIESVKEHYPEEYKKIENIQAGLLFLNRETKNEDGFEKISMTDAPPPGSNEGTQKKEVIAAKALDLLGKLEVMCDEMQWSQRINMYAQDDET